MKVPEFVRKERRKMDPQPSVEVRQFRKVSPPHPACGPPSPSRRRLGASPSGYTNSPGVSPPGTSYRPHQSGLRPASFPNGEAPGGEKHSVDGIVRMGNLRSAPKKAWGTPKITRIFQKKLLQYRQFSGIIISKECRKKERGAPLSFLLTKERMVL